MSEKQKKIEMDKTGFEGLPIDEFKIMDKLSIEYNRAVDKANHLECLKISLDLPTGFNRITGSSLFRPDMILTLAAMKNELSNYLDNTSIYIADIGIPSELYAEFRIRQPEFNPSGIFRVYQQNQA